jgi:16S rRNA G966 N2-methylase RsmD
MRDLLTINEEKVAINCLTNRFEGKFTNEFHYLAYFLDPRYRGELIENDENSICEVLKTLEKYAEDLGLINDEKDREELADCISNFRNKDKLFGCSLLADKIPGKYWHKMKAYSKYKKLATIGSKLLSIPSSSAGVERNFSLQGRTHTKSRNRLKETTIDKLMRIQWALNKKLKDINTLNNEEVELIETQTEDIEELIFLDNPYTEEQLKNLIDNEGIEGVEEFVDREPVPMF